MHIGGSLILLSDVAIWSLCVTCISFKSFASEQPFHTQMFSLARTPRRLPLHGFSLRRFYSLVLTIIAVLSASRSDQGSENQTLEMGMAGMSLVSGYSSGPERKETASTLESSSPRDDVVTDHRQQLQPPPQSVEAYSGGAPMSPSSERVNAKGMSRPPGITGAALPSPIGKPGHSKNTSATSPLLTLTPNSSVDGNSDWHSLGTRQSSPFQGSDAPSLPFLHAEHRRGGHGDDFGSFDLNDGDNDGLLGLEALRDRANSAASGPVPIISNSPPPIARGHFSAHSLGAPPLDMDKPRTVRDRPPLSHSYQEGSGMGMGGFSVSSNRSVGSVSVGSANENNVSVDSSDYRGFGAIGRPELRQGAAEFDMNRRRAASSDNYQNPYAYGGNGVAVAGDPMGKFGSLPTLGSHLQQQRQPDMSDLQKPRHVRSISQPMPNGGAQQIPPGMDARFYQSVIQQEGHSYSGESRFKPHGSASHPTLSSSFEAAQYSQKRVSMPNLGSQVVYGQQGYPTLQRRDALDFQMSPGSVPDEIRSYSGISPAQSPMQNFYGSHSRQPSDAGSALLSSSPRSMASMGSVHRAHSVGSMHHRHLSGSSTGDEDLTHPLVGEHIDVPADHGDMFMSNQYAVSPSLPLGMARSSSHGGMPMDALPPQYIEASHQLPPTAGASLPMPKVVYSVKFKRTQRNFVLGPRISRDLKVGTYVKVEADRGEDLGIVIGKAPADKYNFSRSSFTAGLGPSPGIGGGAADLKRIIRLATHDEVSLLSMKRDEEEELLKICRSKVRQRGLPMNVVDAEYQFDRHKLTFFFEAEGRVDFRELVRDLFSMYKTRIWMQQLDKNTATRSPAIVAPHPSSLQMDYGTPIIAPVSEFADSIVLSGMSAGDARSH